MCWFVGLEAYEILLPDQRSKLHPAALKGNLNHWTTREVPCLFTNFFIGSQTLWILHYWSGFSFFFFFSSFVLFLAVLLSFQGLISLTRDWTWALGSRSTELQPLDCPGGPLHLVFLTLMRGTPFSFTITISQFKQIALSWTSNLFILDGDLLASSLCSAIHGNHCVCGGLSPRIIPPTSLTQPGLFSFYLPLAASIHQLSWQQSQLIRHFGDALANLGWNLSGPVLGWLNQDHLLSLSLIPGKWWNVNYSSHRKPMPPSHSHHLRTLSPFVSSEYSRYDILKEKS